MPKNTFDLYLFFDISYAMAFLLDFILFFLFNK